MAVLSVALAPGARAEETPKEYAIFTPQDIIVVQEGQQLSVSGSPNTKTRLETPQQSSATKSRTSIIKDGQGELLIDQDLSMSSTFEVREGTTTIRNATVNNNPGVESPNLMVSGTQAKLILDNAHYSNSDTNKSYVSGVLVGGQDGDGALTLTNGSSLYMVQGVYAGYASWTQASGRYPNTDSMAGHAPGSYETSASGSPYYADSRRENEQTFSSNLTSPKGAKWAHGSITVEKGSTLKAGTATYIWNATINVDGEGSVYRDSARFALDPKEPDGPEGFSAQICCVDDTIKADINITNGGRFTTYNELDINCNTSQTATTTINVTGEGSVFESRTPDNPHPEDGKFGGSTAETRTAYIGYGYAAVENPSGKVALNLTEGGSARFDAANFGYNGARVETKIDSQSSMTGRLFEMNSGMNLDNKGMVTAETILMNKATVDNTGTITVQVLSKTQGTFTNNGLLDLWKRGDGDTIDGTGAIRFHVQGTAPVDSAILTLTSTALSNSMEAVIDLSDPMRLYGTTTTFLTLNGQLAQGVERSAFSFSGDDNAGNLVWDETEQYATFTYGAGETMGFHFTKATDGNIGSITFDLAPEPATATLGLLALAALATRRRRS